MSITIKNKKTILKDLNLDLGEITIFAGENNSGKTQIIRGIEQKLLEEDGKKVILIPAEKVILDNEITTGAKDDFTNKLNELIDFSIDDTKPFNIENGIQDIDIVLPKLFKEYGVENVEVSVVKGSPTNEEYVKACKGLMIKKALDSITIKDTLSNKEGIPLKDAGQGTERLIVVSLIRFVADKLKSEAREAYLIIEEPEIYLHPKLKKSFYESLKKLSTNSVKVILTTHDPYFISLSETETIYKVFRNKTGETETEKIDNQKGHVLPYRSNAEVNYFIFDTPTIEYALQLYEKFIKGETEKKNVIILFCGRNEKLVDIRNKIAHANYSPKEEELKDFIEGIIKNK